MNIFVDSKMADGDRRKELYRGSIFVHSPRSSAFQLCRLAQELIEQAFSPLNPITAHEHLSAEKCAEILAVLKPKFIHHPRSKEYIRGMLAQLGCDLEKTCIWTMCGIVLGHPMWIPLAQERQSVTISMQRTFRISRLTRCQCTSTERNPSMLCLWPLDN